MSVKEMSDKFVCDLCGTEVVTHDGEAPVGWYELTLVRIPKKGMELGDYSKAIMDDPWDVCSKACLERTIAETGKLIAEMPPTLHCFLSISSQQAPGPLPETLVKPESMTRTELVEVLESLKTLSGAREKMALDISLKTVKRVADMANLGNDEPFEV